MVEERDREEIEILDKVKVLNVKKGDILVLRYKAVPPDNMPHNVWMKHIEVQLKHVKKFVKENYSGYVGLISVPDTIDFEILRLEEWFV